MKNLKITVNGQTYDVQVEEVGESSASVSSAPAPAAAAAPAPAPKKASGGQGATKVNSPMPGTILDIKVSAGQSVTSGQVLLILEAMKMENEIKAPADGTVATIEVDKGASVETGTLLITLD